MGAHAVDAHRCAGDAGKGGAVLSPAEEWRRSTIEMWGIGIGILINAAILVAGYAGVL